MSLNNKVAKDFSCGKEKCSFILCHDIAPFVKETMIEEFREVPYYATLFDKLYNKICKKCQVDFLYLHICCWDDAIGLLNSWGKHLQMIYL